MSRAKDVRAVRSSAALRKALLDLLADKPFDEITVRDICAASGIHYATFFRHHASKEALLDSIAAEQIDILVDLTLPIQQASGHTVAIKKLFTYIDDHRALWSALLNGGASAAMHSEWLSRAHEVEAQHKGTQSWLPEGLGTSTAIAMIFETVTWWLRQPEGASTTDDAAAILSRLLSILFAEE